jgi:hypothetical protein
MPVFAFRARAVLVVEQASDRCSAALAAAQVADLLSGSDYGGRIAGVTRVALDAAFDPHLNPIARRLHLPVLGHVSVVAPRGSDGSDARAAVDFWRRRVVDVLAPYGLSFVRFDLHPL